MGKEAKIPNLCTFISIVQKKTFLFMKCSIASSAIHSHFLLELFIPSKPFWESSRGEGIRLTQCLSEFISCQLTVKRCLMRSKSSLKVSVYKTCLTVVTPADTDHSLLVCWCDLFCLWIKSVMLLLCLTKGKAAGSVGERRGSCEA